MLLAFNLWCSAGSNLSVSPSKSRLTIIVANTRTGLLDKTVIGFNPNSTDTFNSVYDANKLMGMPNRQTLYTMNSGQLMSINILPDEATTDTVPMGMAPGTNDTFSMSFTGMSSFDTTSYVYLEDKKLHIFHNLRNGDYTFTALTTDDWNRFLVHFTPPVIVNGTNITCSSASMLNMQQPGPASWNYSLVNSNNLAIDSGVLNQSQPVNLQVAAGAYSLVLTDSSGYVAVKQLLINSVDTLAAVDFQVSDSAVTLYQQISLAASLQPGDSTISAYQWTFGNGITGSTLDTTINYAKPGLYSLGFTVTNLEGCTATTTKLISVSEPQATAIAETGKSNDVKIWSSKNTVFVDFTSTETVDATVTTYNVIGQEIYNDRCTTGVVYQKAIDNIPAGYLIVKVLNNHVTTVRKVFISNSK